MAPIDNTPEGNLALLLHALKNTPDLKVDYHGLAADINISSANQAQKKFKAIVEKSGEFKLVNGKVELKNADAAAATSSTAGTTTAGPADNVDDDDDAEPATPTKKRKTKTTTPKRSRKGRPVAQAIPEFELPDLF